MFLIVWLYLIFTYFNTLQIIILNVISDDLKGIVLTAINTQK